MTGGATNNQDCAQCDEGFYCAQSSQPRPDGPCSAGHYCVNGSRTPNQTQTEPGFFSPAGSSAPQPCQPGFYNPFNKQSECLPCKAGYYCPTNKMIHPIECRRGFYCPRGSDREYECPPGTFNNYTKGLSLNASCAACPAGSYCQSTANVLPTGKRRFICIKTI